MKQITPSRKNKTGNGIPLYKSSLIRDDLEAVLESMINYQLSPGELAKKLAEDLAQECDCAGGIIFRDYRTALYTLFQLLSMNENSSLLLSPLLPTTWYECAHARTIRQYYTPLIPGTVLPDLKNTEIDSYDVVVADTTLGFIPDYSSLCSMSKTVVENIGHGFGGMYTNKMVGCFGDYVIITLEYDSIITTGGGVALLVKNVHTLNLLNKIVKRLPNDIVIADYNAALGLAQLNRHKTFIKKRRLLASMYRKNLISHHAIFNAPNSKVYTPYAFAIYCTGNIQTIKSFIKKQHIDVEHFGINAIANSKPQILERVKNRSYIQDVLHQTLLLPLYPSLSDAEITKIIAIVSNLP